MPSTTAAVATGYYATSAPNSRLDPSKATQQTDSAVTHNVFVRASIHTYTNTFPTTPHNPPQSNADHHSAQQSSINLLPFCPSACLSSGLLPACCLPLHTSACLSKFHIFLHQAPCAPPEPRREAYEAPMAFLACPACLPCLPSLGQA